MRGSILLIHRWVGLVCLLFLAIAGATGAVIAFSKELDRAINPEWNYVQPQGERLSLDQLVARIQAHYPEARITYAKIEQEPDRSFRFLASRKPAEGEGTKLVNQHVFVNPYSGEILGVRQSGTFAVDRPNLIPFLSKIHYTLFLGDWGKWFMGGVAVLWLLDHFGAAYLSFPNAKAWKKSFLVRWQAGGYKLNFDLHRAGGLWLLPVLFMLALTSVELNLKTPFVWVVNQFSEVHLKPCICKVDGTANWLAETSSWDGAVSTAQIHLPNLTPGSIMFYPDEAKFRVSMKGPDDIADSGMTYVYINAITGDPMMLHDRGKESAGDTFLAWMYPLHTGRAFGLLGQIIISLAGVVVTVLSITGLVIYSKKLGARIVRREKEAQSIDSAEAAGSLSANEAKSG